MTIISLSTSLPRVSRRTWLQTRRTYLTAWQQVTQGAEHLLAKSPSSDRAERRSRLHGRGDGGHRRIFVDGMETMSYGVPGFLRGSWDDIAKRLSSAEGELGLEPFTDGA